MEPTELFNILNQQTVYPTVSDPNYLFLIDARIDDEYDASHIVTAKRSRRDDLGHYYLPFDAELECKTHVVVYDGNCKSKKEESSPAMTLAKLAVENGSKNPVKILQGGYEDFSALYPFLRTQKIMFTPRELDSFTTYPCEIIKGMVFLGDFTHASCKNLNNDLKIKSYLHLSTDDEILEMLPEKPDFLQISIEDNVDADFGSHIDEALKFISTRRSSGKPVLITSDKGISRSAGVCIAYVMSYYSWSLKEAWKHVQGCKHNIRPNRGIVEDLAKFEEKLLKKKITDVSDPYY